MEKVNLQKWMASKGACEEYVEYSYGRKPSKVFLHYWRERVSEWYERRWAKYAARKMKYPLGVRNGKPYCPKGSLSDFCKTLDGYFYSERKKK